MIDEVFNPLMFRPMPLKSRWSLSIESNSEFIEGKLENQEFIVKSISIPFEKIETETYVTGEKMPSRYVYPDTFSIELYENKDFDVMDYFKKWIDSIYDLKTKRFRKDTRYTTYGIRQGTLVLYDDNVLADVTFLKKSNLLKKIPLNQLKRIDLYNIKCLGIEPLSLSKEDDNFITYSITFSVDQVGY